MHHVLMAVCQFLRTPPSPQPQIMRRFRSTGQPLAASHSYSVFPQMWYRTQLPQSSQPPSFTFGSWITPIKFLRVNPIHAAFSAMVWCLPRPKAHSLVVMAMNGYIRVNTWMSYFLYRLLPSICLPWTNGVQTQHIIIGLVMFGNIPVCDRVPREIPMGAIRILNLDSTDSKIPARIWFSPLTKFNDV